MFCPFSGSYKFKYSSRTKQNCEAHMSEISDCPYGFGLNLQFKDCDFGDLEMSFHCLGDWAHPNGDRYVALMDTGTDPTKPRYRCARYSEDLTDGKIHLALSSDSTCVSNLLSAKDGHENFHLVPKSNSELRTKLDSSCVFPQWMQGNWEHIIFHEDSFQFKDLRNFKTHKGKCIPETNGDTEKFLVYTRSQCGDEEYKCLW